MGVSPLLDGFDLSGSAIAGESGPPLLSKATGFGMIVEGKGRYAGDIAVVCRGTASWRDWLTDFNASLMSGPAGLPVHTGFGRTYNTMRDGVNSGLRGKNPTNIHVVGHSLGGALASLFAMQFADEKRANVHLYTFGAPRPGTGMFSSALNAGVGGAQIKRVFARADVVPMVPLWPFEHPDAGLRTERGGSIIAVSSHFMSNYMPAVFQKDWGALSTESANSFDVKSIDDWLDIAGAQMGGGWSSTALWALGKALKGILAIIKGTVGFAIIGAATVIDTIVMALHRGITFIGEQISYWTRKLIEGIMAFMGRAATTVQDMSRAFLRYVIELFFRSLASIASRAIDGLPKV